MVTETTDIGNAFSCSQLWWHQNTSWEFLLFAISNLPSSVISKVLNVKSQMALNPNPDKHWLLMAVNTPSKWQTWRIAHCSVCGWCCQTQSWCRQTYSATLQLGKYVQRSMSVPYILSLFVCHNIVLGLALHRRVFYNRHSSVYRSDKCTELCTINPVLGKMTTFSFL